MNTDPITEAVVAAMDNIVRMARDDMRQHPDRTWYYTAPIEAAATALLRDLARLQRPVVWKRVKWERSASWPRFAVLYHEMPPREVLDAEYEPFAYSSLPGADAP